MGAGCHAAYHLRCLARPLFARFCPLDPRAARDPRTTDWRVEAWR